MTRMAFAISVALLFGAGAALAQSGQGGYLGENAAKNQSAASTRTQAPKGSAQGGYLGQNPAANPAPVSKAQPQAQPGSGQGGYLGRAPGK
jgi:hypothetical protein